MSYGFNNDLLILCVYSIVQGFMDIIRQSIAMMYLTSIVISPNQFSLARFNAVFRLVLTLIIITQYNFNFW